MIGENAVPDAGSKISVESAGCQRSRTAAGLVRSVSVTDRDGRAFSVALNEVVFLYTGVPFRSEAKRTSSLPTTP